MKGAWARIGGSIFCLIIATLTLSVLGCAGTSDPKVTVSGKVTYKGKPLPSVMLAFSGPNGSYAVSQVQEDGSFIMTDVMPGEQKVSVMAAPSGSGSSDLKDPKKSQGNKSVELPSKYFNPATSELTCSITGATSNLEIKIE